MGSDHEVSVSSRVGVRIWKDIRDGNGPVLHRYRLIRVIGMGAHGKVFLAEDCMAGNKLVAIKRICDSLVSPQGAIRLLRELKLLRLLRGHPNIIRVLDVIPSSKELQDCFVVFERMDGDLRKIIQKNPAALTKNHVKSFMSQILQGLAHLHRCGVLHRDLKPDNILVNRDCSLKISDFGLARAQPQNLEVVFFTQYVATRWYRAPELFLSRFTNYSTAVDIWSVGCIFAEMLSAEPLFPGRDKWEILRNIVRVTGRPSHETIGKVKNLHDLEILQKLAELPTVSIKDVVPRASDDALDLLKRLLEFDPDDRISAEEALRHPYFSTCDWLPKAEMSPAAQAIASDEFSFERRLPNVTDLRSEFLKEVSHYCPEGEMADSYYPADFYGDVIDRHCPLYMSLPRGPRLRDTDSVTDHSSTYRTTIGSSGFGDTVMSEVTDIYSTVTAPDLAKLLSPEWRPAWDHLGSARNE